MEGCVCGWVTGWTCVGGRVDGRGKDGGNLRCGSRAL